MFQALRPTQTLEDVYSHRTSPSALPFFSRSLSLSLSQPDAPPTPTQDQEEEEENAHLGEVEGFGLGTDDGVVREWEGVRMG